MPLVYWPPPTPLIHTLSSLLHHSTTFPAFTLSRWPCSPLPCKNGATRRELLVLPSNSTLLPSSLPYADLLLLRERGSARYIQAKGFPETLNKFPLPLFHWLEVCHILLTARETEKWEFSLFCFCGRSSKGQRVGTGGGLAAKRVCHKYSPTPWDSFMAQSGFLYYRMFSWRLPTASKCGTLLVKEHFFSRVKRKGTAIITGLWLPNSNSSP